MRATLRRLSKRCSAFAAIYLGLEMHPPLAAFLDSDAPEIALLWSRQVGKSTGMGAKLVHGAIMQPRTLGLIISASQKQAERVQRICAQFMLDLGRHEQWQLVSEDEAPDYDADGVRMTKRSVMSLELSNGSEIRSLPATQETIRGYSPHRIALDECAWVPDDVYHAIRPMRIKTRAQLIMSSSAGAQRGWFYELWRKRAEGGVWWSELIARDCEILDWAEQEAAERAAVPLWVYEREYENVWSPMAGGLFSPDMIRDMYDGNVAALPWAGAKSNGHQVAPMQWGKR